MSNILNDISQLVDDLMQSNDYERRLKETQPGLFTCGAMVNDINDRYLRVGHDLEKAAEIVIFILEVAADGIEYSIQGMEKGLEAAGKAAEDARRYQQPENLFDRYSKTIIDSDFRKCELTGEKFYDYEATLLGKNMMEDFFVTTVEYLPCNCLFYCRRSPGELIASMLQLASINDRAISADPQDLSRRLDEDVFLQIIRDDAPVKKGIFRTVTVQDVVAKDVKKIKSDK